MRFQLVFSLTIVVLLSCNRVALSLENTPYSVTVERFRRGEKLDDLERYVLLLQPCPICSNPDTKSEPHFCSDAMYRFFREPPVKKDRTLFSCVRCLGRRGRK